MLTGQPTANRVGALATRGRNIFSRRAKFIRKYFSSEFFLVFTVALDHPVCVIFFELIFSGQTTGPATCGSTTSLWQVLSSHTLSFGFMVCS